MYKQKKFLQLSASAALLAAIVLPQAAGAAGQAAPTTQSLATVAPVNTAALSTEWSSYVKQQYGVNLSGTVTREQFAAALVKVVAAGTNAADHEAAAKGFLPEAKAGTAKLAAWEAISAAVKAAELKELAYTYSEPKVTASWKKAGLSYQKGGAISLQHAQEVAAAIDTGLVPAKTLSSLTTEGEINAELAYHLLGKVAEFHGKYKNFLGTVTEEDIYGKLAQAWTESQIIKAGELQELVDQGLKQNLITGYNLKDAAFDPHFDPERTLTYGHSDIVHAIQLIALLKSEGINAKVQFEPKTSAFIYLKEWGEPVQTDDYQVVQIENGNFIAYAKEYDLSFEFANVDEKKRFQPLVLQYAKRNQEDMIGLLKGSWWQPLYHSRTELAEYPVITNNVLQQGRYIVQSFSLNEQSAKVVEGFKKIDPKVQIETYKFWVDQPFYNYLIGDYK
jgi:citrate lyase gamma subunit